MNQAHWSTHVKHVLIALLIVGGVVGAFVVRGKYEAYIADRNAARDEKISQNQVAVAQAQKANQSDQATITDRDLENAKEIASLRAQLSQGLTPAQADALIAQRLAGLGATSGKDSKGQDTTTVPTSGLADLLNKSAINQHICDSNLGTCEADKATLNGIIARDADIHKIDQTTIKTQGDQITELKKFQVPRWTLLAGVGKTQGSSFQDANSYQPWVGIDYRLTSRFGIGGGAQNKSAVAWLSWRFGAVAK